MKIPVLVRSFTLRQSRGALRFPPRSHAPRSHAPSRSQRRGSTIFITLIVAALVALTLGAYLTWSVRYLIELVRLRAAVPEA